MVVLVALLLAPLTQQVHHTPWPTTKLVTHAPCQAAAWHGCPRSAAALPPAIKAAARLPNPVLETAGAYYGPHAFEGP
jgi:hypothetical protein